MYGRVSFDKENVFINGTKIVGVTDFSANIGFSRTPISLMGIGYAGQALEGEITRSFSLTKYIGDSESGLIGLLGEDITGQFKYQSSHNSYSQEWKATRARISSYEFSCAVGDLPSSSYSFEVFGGAEFSGTQLTNEQEEEATFSVIRPGDLIFSGDDHFVTNRMQSFKYAMSIPYKKTNLIGGEFTPVFSQNEPIEVSVDMEFELDGLDEEISTYPLCDKNFNGTFIFNKCGEEIRRFSITGAELTDSRINGTVGSNATFGVTYKGYKNANFETYYEGTEYFNLYPNPVIKTIFEGKTTYDKFQFEVNGQILKCGVGWSGEEDYLSASLRRRCKRILFYTGVYHDGTKYYLNTPIVAGPRKSGGTDITNEEPYVNKRWNYYGYSGVSKGTGLHGAGPVGYRAGSDLSFDIDESRLYANLAGANIKKGVLHDVVLHCDNYYLSNAGNKALFITGANTKITAKAYYKGE